MEHRLAGCQPFTWLGWGLSLYWMAAYNRGMRTAVLGMILLLTLGSSCGVTPNVVGVQDYGSVTGRVLDATTNQPIAGALVSVGSSKVAQADARGGFVVREVPIGDQTVEARSPGYDTASADVTVAKNQAVDAGYLRLVPLIHPAGQPTLPPPATPSPQPSPSASPSPSGSPGASPAPGASPLASPAASPSPSAAPPT